jgi:hypothetical protein
MILLISNDVSEGSNPTLSATLSALDSMAYSAHHFLLPNYCQIPGILGDESRSAGCDLDPHLLRGNLHYENPEMQRA